uniref:Macaca fascicularis brain cDNA clone: QmoA-10034, similar to human EGF, latrophilin and seven transmembrane domaincontaining 1 (ELTD1), mRNA, RefSeq: XM_371262.1 n=1 Tax=Macaca fascicularis TaxID=9541 RepID=I7GH37_MACFA|nr:unnamed protein product [Macaca fascicularis]
MLIALTQKEVIIVCVYLASDPAVTKTGLSLMMEPSV